MIFSVGSQLPLVCGLATQFFTVILLAIIVVDICLWLAVSIFGIAVIILTSPYWILGLYKTWMIVQKVYMAFMNHNIVQV